MTIIDLIPFKVTTYKSENFEGFFIYFLSLNTNLMTLVTINVIMLMNEME